MVYVVANDGQPLMPTNRYGKVYRLFDKVRYQGREYFIFGRRKSGFFDIRTLSGHETAKIIFPLSGLQDGKEKYYLKLTRCRGKAEIRFANEGAGEQLYFR